MPTASSRAAARSALLEVMAAADLEADGLMQARQHRAEADRLQGYGAEVEATRKELARLQEEASHAAVSDTVLAALARAVVKSPLDLAPVAERRRGARELQQLDAELSTLSADRGLVARARTKARRLRLSRRITHLSRGDADADVVLGRRLVDEGWLEAARHPVTNQAVDAVLSHLSGAALELAPARALAQAELKLERLPTALDLRPLLSRTRAEEGAAREAADGAETEAIEALLTSKDPMPPPITSRLDALRAARSAEHEQQRVSLEAQLEAIDGEVE